MSEGRDRQERGRAKHGGVLPLGERITGITAVILAGGQGRRITEVCRDIPKPLVVAAGRPFLYWVTAWAVSHGILDIVYSVGYLAEQIELWASSTRCRSGVRVRCRREEEPLGTGGGVVNCLDMCAATVLVLNGDSLILMDLGSAVHHFKREHLDIMMVATEVDEGGRYGSVEMDADGLMRAFSEKRGGPGLINAGVYLFRKSLLARYSGGGTLSLECEVLPAALAEGLRVGVFPTGAPFLDIGTPASVELASSFVEANRRMLPDFSPDQPRIGGFT